jgi:hypothetical protein
MTAIARSDIFFTVTTVAVVALSVFVALALWNVIRILSEVRRVARKVREEGEAIVADVGGLRRQFIQNIRSSFTRKTRKTRTKNEKTTSTEE